MIPPIITKKVSKKKIRKLDEADTKAFAKYDPEKDRHIIYIPYRASTKTRLHEIRHCELGHTKSANTKMPVSEFIDQEIEAEVYAFEKCGKALSTNILDNLAHYTIVDLGASHSPVFNGIINSLAKRQYKLDKNQRRDLWNVCREFEDERRRE